MGFLTGRAKKPLGFAIIDLDLANDEITNRVVRSGREVLCECCLGRAVFDELRDEAYRCDANPNGFIEAHIFDVTRCGHIDASHKHRLLKADDPVALGIRQFVEKSGVVH